MKFIVKERFALLLILLNCFCFQVLGGICWDDSHNVSFEATETRASGRYDLSDIQTSDKISIGIPAGYTFNGETEFSTNQYCVVTNPSVVSANYVDQEATDGGVLLVSKPQNDASFPYLQFKNLSLNTVYTISFEVMNPVLTGSSCKLPWQDHIGTKACLVNPQTNSSFEGILGNDEEWRDIPNDGKSLNISFTFNSGSLSEVNVIFKEFASLADCSALGIKNINISGNKCLRLQTSQTVICTGRELNIYADEYKGTATSFDWLRKQEGEANFTLYKTTDEPALKDIPSKNVAYQLVVNEDSSNIVNVEVGDKCLYITPHYSSNLCVDDTNTLIASGYVVLDHINSSDFLWEEYDEESSSWKALDSKTMKQKIKPEKTTKYRVTLGGETVEYMHQLQPCTSIVCDSLDSEVVFMETFGFFMDSVTYVDTKDLVHQNTITTGSAGQLKIQKYWAPDPYDFIVYPTQFEQAINSNNGQPVVFDNEPVMYGKDGHQYALLDPRNPDPTSDRAIRRNGGYTWCNNQDNMQGNYRVEDGFYALVRNPKEADCGNGDFWDGKDHTGNHNGAMLMVNCGPTKATIYSQRVDVGCSNLNLNFSAYISNAISKKQDPDITQTMTPVNITFRIQDLDGNIIQSQNSEDILCLDSLEWKHQTMQFESGSYSQFDVQLVNNGLSGYGNDILLDDISFSICLPKVILVTEGMDIDNPQPVRICNDTTLRMFARQKKEILKDPLFRFQYKDRNGEWQDVIPDQTDFSSNSVDVKSADSRFWGEVEFRVIVAESEEVLNKVTKGERLSKCDIYTMANSTLTIFNSYGGPMNPNENVEVCKGETVHLTGGRVNETKPDWNHEWSWGWEDAEGNTINGYEKNSDLAKKTLTYTVNDTVSKFYFVAYDEGCELRQEFQLIGKTATGLDIKADLWESCDSLKLYPNIVSPTTVLRWIIDGNEEDVRLGDTIVIKPETLPANGYVLVDIDSSSSIYCPAEPVKIPYNIHAGESLSVSLSAGGINKLCLDPEKYDTITLQARVTPEASQEDVKYYLWSLNGNPIDTTTTRELLISTDPANKHHGILEAGRELIFEVRVADGVCFTVDEPSDPGYFTIEVNESYRLDLVSMPNDSICLTDLKSDTVVVLNAIATSVANPEHDVQKMIKKYIWRVDGTKFAETETPEFVVLMSNHPSELDKYLKAGTSPIFTVAAIDSICFQSEGDAPKGEVKVVFNEAYSMKISPDGKVLCIPAILTEEDWLLLTLSVETDPAEAKNHVQEYMWYVNDEYFRSTKSDTIQLRYSALKDLIGTTAQFSVKSYDGICSDKTNPADNSNKVLIDIRYGGYALDLDVLGDKLCIDTLNPENNKIDLSVSVLPEDAKTNIEKYYWMESGVVIDSTQASEITLTQAKFPDIFKAGKTAVFNVKTFDAICSNEFVYGSGTGEKFYINESYTMELDADVPDSVCFDNANVAKLTLTAKVSPSEAANHIKVYRWYKNGTLLDSTQTNSIEITNDKYPGSIVAGENPTFSVDSYDGICFTGDKPSDQASKTIVISFRYKLELDHEGKDSLCLGSESIKLTAMVTPEGSKQNISVYFWEMTESGITTSFDTTYAPIDYVVISKANYPDFFKAGMSATFKVKSVDGICYTIENPNVSEGVKIEINDYYQMKLVNNGPSILCYSEELDPSLSFQAVVDPAGAMNHIKWYRWYKDGVLLDSTKTPTIEISNGKYPGVFEAGSKPIFSVDSYDGFCYSPEDPSKSDGVEVTINQAYTMTLESSGTALCLGSDEITLTASVSPKESANSITDYYWKVNGILFETTHSPVNSITLSFDNYPDLLNSIAGTAAKFSVESVDGICFTVDNPAKSEPVTIEIGGSYEIALEVPSDSICFDDEATVSLKLTAKLNPSSNLFKWYRWYENGVLLDSTTTDYLEVNNQKYPGSLTAGANPTFSVDGYDNICYTSENPAKSGEVQVIMNQRFNMHLDSGDKDYLCSGSDSITLTAIIDPEGSKTNVSKYYWTMDGMPFDTTTVDHIVLSRDNYPTLFKANTTPSFGVKAVDGICYTDNDPAVSSDIIIRVNELFDVKIRPNTDQICASGNNSILYLSADVTPYSSHYMIQEYSWYMVKGDSNESILLGKSSDKDSFLVTGIAPGEYSFYVEAVDGICFSVNPAKSDSTNISVHENIFVNLAADKLKYCTESSNQQTPAQIELTATVTQGTPSRYVVYDGHGELFEIETSQKIVSFTVTPTIDNHGFQVKVFDDVCNYNDATAATNGNPVEIAVFDPIEIGLKADKENVCLGDTVHLSLDLTQGSPVQYTWYGTTYDGKDVTIRTSKKDTIISDVPVASGYRNYVLVASDGICDDAIVSYENVFVRDNIKLNLLSDIDKVTIGGKVNFYADVLSGEPIAYIWKVDGEVIAVTEENELLEYPKAPSVYTVEATDSVCFHSEASKEIDVDLPTAFTPTAVDDMNDWFMKGFKVEIFNRYGQLIFTGDDGWDGMTFGSMADPGVYFYSVVLKNGKTMKGTIELVKLY
ncbi:MAG TPA: gliding motility-associated C-terminal domain-containing protein [Paludibacteraceae bacterium]|nr:gliding motility-associated C-terminal domain-containing protein [Paludibacteraceae bacterium]